MLTSTDFLINDTGPLDYIFYPHINGERKARGAVPRDYSVDPYRFMGPPSEITIIPRSEWDARIEEKVKTKSQLSDIRNRGNNGGQIPALDQGQIGYCWAHSTTHCLMLCRALARLPYIPLSAYSIASTIKNGRDEGGWCGLSMKFAAEKGCAPQSLWPQGDRSLRWAGDIAEQAKAFIPFEFYYDLAKPEYGQSMTFDQVATCLLLNIPLAVDFNWWSHSVCALDLVRISAGNYGLRILNSWSDNWGDKGTGVLEGSKAIPDGAIGVRVMTAV